MDGKKRERNGEKNKGKERNRMYDNNDPNLKGAAVFMMTRTLQVWIEKGVGHMCLLD